MSQANTVAALPAASGILHSTAHLAEQSSGKGSQVLATRAHRLSANGDYSPSGPCAATHVHAYTAASADHTGGGHTSRIMEDISLSNTYDSNVREKVLRSACIDGKSIRELIRVVEAIEMAQIPAARNEPVTTADYSHIKETKQDTGNRPQQAQRQSNVTRPRGLTRGCGNMSMDHAVMPNNVLTPGKSQERLPAAKGRA